MRSDYEIRRMTNEDQDFYPLMGPCLSRKAISHELGSPVWDDDGKVWFTAISYNKVIGFAAYLVINEETVSLCSDYVFPDFRRQGIYSELFTKRMIETVGFRRVAMATEASLPIFMEFGFLQRRKLANFTRVEYLL